MQLPCARPRPAAALALTVALTLAALPGAAAARSARAAPVAAPAQAGLVPSLLSALTGNGGQGAPAPPAPPAPAPSAAACAGAASAGDTPITLSSDGLTRNAVLHLPRAPAGKALALIVAFHGYGGNGARFELDSGLSSLGDADGYAVVYPSSAGRRWEIHGNERDVAFISDLLDRVESMACIDHRRIYGTGVSIGAGMAARIGCELSGRVAALVLVSGGYRALDPCNVDRPVSVLEIHGTSDSTVPYHGQGPGSDGAVLPYVAAWAARDRCRARPTKRLVAAHTVLYRWSGCASGAVVEHLRIYGSGHGLPNAAGSEISAGHRTALSGVRNIWHFLAARSLGGAFPDQPAERAAASPAG